MIDALIYLLAEHWCHMQTRSQLCLRSLSSAKLVPSIGSSLDAHCVYVIRVLISRIPQARSNSICNSSISWWTPTIVQRWGSNGASMDLSKRKTHFNLHIRPRQSCLMATKTGLCGNFRSPKFRNWGENC